MTFIKAKDTAELTEMLIELQKHKLAGKLGRTIKRHIKLFPDHTVIRYHDNHGYDAAFRPFLFEGIPTLNVAQFKKMLADRNKPFVKSRPSFYMGFEIEGCIHPNYRDGLIDYVRDLYPNVSVDNLIHHDGSIRPKCQAIEIVTPPMVEARAIEKLEWLFGMLGVLSDEGVFQTNGTCGFHVNLSERKTFEYPNQEARDKFTFEFMKRIDPKKWRQKFGRSRNKYCWWTRHPESIQDIDLNGPTAEAANRFGESFAKAKHWAAINTSHLHSDNQSSRRLEIRVAGGKDYHRKSDEMRDFLLDIRGAMAEAYGSI